MAQQQQKFSKTWMVGRGSFEGKKRPRGALDTFSIENLKQGTSYQYSLNPAILPETGFTQISVLPEQAARESQHSSPSNEPQSRRKSYNSQRPSFTANLASRVSRPLLTKRRTHSKRPVTRLDQNVHPALELYQRRFERIKERNRRMFEQDKLNKLKGEFGEGSVAVKHQLNLNKRTQRAVSVRRNKKSLTPIKHRLPKNKDLHNRNLSTGVAPYLKAHIPLEGNVKEGALLKENMMKYYSAVVDSGKNKEKLEQKTLRDPLRAAKYSSVLRSMINDKLDIEVRPHESPRHPILKQASKMIKVNYKGRTMLNPKSTEKQLAQIKARSERERDHHINALKSMSEMNPRLRGFFWAPDLSYAAFAPPHMIKETKEKWDMSESRLNLAKTPESNVEGGGRKTRMNE